MKRFEGQGVEEFAKWYIENDMPKNFPQPILRSSIRTWDTFLMFKQDRYVVQFYIMKKDEITPWHAHPGVHAKLVPWLSNEQRWHMDKPYTYDDELHAGELGFVEDTPLLVFTEWDEGVPMTNLHLHWVGDCVDDIHKKELEEHWGVKIENNYFDVRDVM